MRLNKIVTKREERDARSVDGTRKMKEKKSTQKSIPKVNDDAFIRDKKKKRVKKSDRVLLWG